MNNALLYFGGILITALGVLFAVPHFIDWNSYRGIFEEEATRILGREVRVGGAVNVRLLPAPYVSFEKLRIADSSDEGGNSIIRVDSFTMWLSVPPLLRGVLEANRVELGRPVVHLAANSTGSGNWRTLTLSPGSIPFAPKNVALQSVEIKEGAIIVDGPARGELARFDAIDGELTAEALEGPFKFKGRGNWDGAQRHLRLATGKFDSAGELRFKAAVDVPESGNSYMLDGRLSDLGDSPKLEGDLIARLALAPGADGAKAAAPPVAPQASAPPSAPPHDSGSAKPTASDPAIPALDVPAPAPGGPSNFELRSKVKGTTLGVELADIAISLDAGTTPQLITGKAKFDWTNAMRLDVELASRWLDLDQLARGTAPRMPLEAARSYFDMLASALPTEADTNARLEFDQLTLGGEPIANVRLAASRSNGPLELKGVRADLPGGVRLQLDGILKPGPAPQLDGMLFVSGKSLMRFLAWGLAKPDVARDRSDGPFSLDGNFALGGGSIALTDATVELAGTPLTGDLKLDLGPRRKLAMAIEGPHVDAAQIGSGMIGLNALRATLFGGPSPEDGSTAQAGSLFDPRSADLSLQLKVAELVDGERNLRDVDADIRLESGKLSIPSLKFSTPEGLTFEAEGEAMNVPAQPQGSLRGLVAIPNAKAARAFLTLLDLDTDLDRLSGLAPARVAGTLRLGGGAANASDLSLDGTVGGGRLSASVHLDGGRAQWRSSPMDLQVSLDSPDAAGVVARLFDAPITRDSADVPKAGRILIKASGTPERGLLSLADVAAEDVTLTYRGQIRLPGPGDTQIDGDLRFVKADAQIALSLAGLSASEGVAGIPVGGTLRVNRDATALKLTSDAMTIGDSTIAGAVSIASQGGNRRTVDAALRADKAVLGSLLAPILGKTFVSAAPDAAAANAPRIQARAPAGAQPPEEAGPIWPEQAFDLSFLERIDGKVDLQIGALSVEPGLTLGNAHLEARLTPQAITLARLDGDALGGRFTSQIDLNKAPAGIALNGSLRIDIASKPAAPDAGVTPPPGDVAAFHVSLASHALSPAAIISALTGKGELTIGDATLNGNSPAAVAGVARAALTGQGPSGGNGLADAIKAALKLGEVPLGKLTIPVEISDGDLKLDKVRIDLKDGRSTFATAVELATMKIDSEWQIEPKLDVALAAKPERAFLPPVTVVYAGKISQLSALEPTVSAGALERELVVRKMELDVGELERLRKQDQERARQDAERRKAQEDDVPATPPTAPAPVPAPAPQAAPPAPQATSPPDPSASNSGTEEVIEGDGSGTPSADAQGVVAPPTPVPSPASERAPKRRKPVEDNWRPFQQPF